MTFTIDATTHISPNHSSRKNPTPSAIVLHSTEGTRASDLPWLKKVQGEKSVSCHYYVCRDGTIYQLVPDWREAWHAGVSEYLGFVGWGDFSLGLELEHKSGQNWPEIQRQAAKWLCKLLITKYEIRRSMVVAHRWIAPARKVDPTDWPDVALMAWIEELYADDYAAEWGDAAPFHVTWGIPSAFITAHKAGKPWGKCLGPEYAFDGGAIQRFERCLVTWTPESGVVVWWRA